MQLYRSQEGKLWEVDLCQLNAWRASISQLTCWPAEYRPHGHHHQNNYSHLCCPHTSCCLSVLLFFSLTPVPASFWKMTHSPHCISHSVSLLACLFLLLSLRTGDSPCLCVSALLSLLSFSRPHYKGWSPIELINPQWTPFTRWLMSLRRGLSPGWQLLLSRNILMAPLPTKMLCVDQTHPTHPAETAALFAGIS